MVRPTESKLGAREAAALSVTLSIGLLAAYSPAYAVSVSDSAPSVFDNIVEQDAAASSSAEDIASVIADSLGEGENAVIALPSDQTDAEGNPMVSIIAVGDEEFQAQVGQIIDNAEAAVAAEGEGVPAPAADAAPEATPEPTPTPAAEAPAPEPEQPMELVVSGSADAQAQAASFAMSTILDDLDPEEANQQFTIMKESDAIAVSTYEQLQSALSDSTSKLIEVKLFDSINLKAPLMLAAGKSLTLYMQEKAIVPADVARLSSFFKIVGESSDKTVITIYNGALASPIVGNIVETNGQTVELYLADGMLYSHTLFDTPDHWKCSILGDGIFMDTIEVGDGSSFYLMEDSTFRSDAAGCAIHINGGDVYVTQAEMEFTDSSADKAAVIVDRGSMRIYSGEFTCDKGDMLYCAEGASIQIDSGTFKSINGNVINPTSNGAFIFDTNKMSSAEVNALLPANYAYENGQIVYHEPPASGEGEGNGTGSEGGETTDPAEGTDPQPSDPVGTVPAEPSPVKPGQPNNGPQGAVDDGWEPLRPASSAERAIDTLGAALQSPDVPLPFTGFYASSMLKTDDALDTRDANEEDATVIASSVTSDNGSQGDGESAFDDGASAEVDVYPTSSGFSLDPVPTGAVLTGIAAAVLIGAKVSSFSAVNAAAAVNAASGPEPKKSKKPKSKKKAK